MLKRFHSNLLYVSDLEVTDQFYEKLGFETSKADETIRIKLGDFTLALIDENKTPIKNESGLKPKGTGIYIYIYIYIEVEDVDKYFSFVKENGIIPRTEPRNWPWGKREFVVKDPDDYKLVFYSLI